MFFEITPVCYSMEKYEKNWTYRGDPVFFLSTYRVDLENKLKTITFFGVFRVFLIFFQIPGWQKVTIFKMFFVTYRVISKNSEKQSVKKDIFLF